MTELIFIIIFSFLLIFYLYFITGVYTGLSKHPPKNESKVIDEFISVIIPFRNESGIILESLRSIENQNYPKERFEVIYVNDSSNDNSLAEICNAQKSSNIKVLSLPAEFQPNAHKKRAVRFGIENCRGEIIVTTDADCIHKPDWLKSLVSCYDSETGFISGPVEFKKGESIFNKLQRIEFAGLILSGAGLIGINKPAICNAANASYRKEAYLSVNGFDDNIHLSSGDDEILMQKIHRSKKYKIRFCMDRNAVVECRSNRTFSRFYQQRKRWASKGLFYINKLLIIKMILIFLFYLSLIVQLLSGIFISYTFLLTFLLAFLLKIFPEFLIINRGKKLLFDKSISESFILAEILHIPYIVFFAVAGIFGNYIWKGRMLKR